MLLIEYVLNRSVNTLAVLYRVLKSSFCLCLHLFPFLTCARSDGSGKTALQSRLV